MARHLVVRSEGRADEVGQRLTALDAHIEVFALDDGDLGVSVPEKVIEAIGEDAVPRALADLTYYDLWSGEWHNPPPRRSGWLGSLFGKR
ncbi:hypothetical protein ATO6_10550 [Oceanicola sp. 22II-s10i]|uniref:hypothetical protein n=1 Tax=Oceanicola sp. 22II-s10i TaxID=1317116 RepID=UPI000B5226E9|nr:hypothetical protein [Oceanicola sp. 22II-s10i]OWU84761.1 hypothetical protein ATO6_10550 [Oceanicola sp. 22II-s10i]